jgi:cobyrinic acid a,c-diamide synthase
MKGLIVAAPRSGSGKTLVTLGLMAAARARGLRVAGAKIGPDYIDPAFHTVATGMPSVNLDGWSMPPALVDALAARQAAEADIVIMEAAMGLFDGVAAEPGRSGAGADLAARLGLPVLLVLDVSGQSQTAGALAFGMARFDPAVNVAGVIANRVASDRHAQQVEQGLARAGLPLLGRIPRDNDLAVPERHLGLVQAGEIAGLETLLAKLGEKLAAAVDLDALLVLAGPIRTQVPDAGHLIPPPPGQRVAVARDAAFSFLYPHLLEGWRMRGAELCFFSPLADEAPPADADSCWLAGGYPELHAGALAAAKNFRDGLADFARTRPVHGECGGYMVLGRTLEDADGVIHPMASLLDHATSFKRRKLALGYRRAELLADAALGPAGMRLRGHEFHYATVSEPGHDQPLCRLHDATGRDLGPAGGVRGRVSGSFLHVICGEG